MKKAVTLPSKKASKGFFARIKNYIQNCETSYLFWAFFLPAAVMFALYAAMGAYPFGERSVMTLDLNGQYIYFFEGLRDLVYGEGDFLYTFNRALGGEFMGIYAYYLASPLSYIVCLFPKENIVEAMYTILVLKCGLCGLTFGYYLHKSAKLKSKSAVLMFSMMYALCGYCVVYQHNVMWTDCVILLPLIALGIEQLIAERKYILFTVSLALAILSNYYIGYMVCIFVFIYAIYAYFSRTEEDNNPLGEKYHLLRAVSRVAVFAIIAIGISMIITIPAAYSLTFGKDEFSTAKFSPTQRFDFIDLFARFFIGSYDTVRPEGLPIVYSGILALVLLPLYFMCSKRPKRERIGTAILIVFFILCFNFNPVDMAWHGFAIPNWLNYRYSFMLCFIIIIAGAKAFDEISTTAPRNILTVCLALGFAVLIMQKMELKSFPDFSGVWLSLGFITVYCIALSLVAKAKLKETANSVLCVIVCLEMFCGGLMNLIGLNNDVFLTKRDGYVSFVENLQPIIDLIKSEDTSFYRMEKTHHRKVCDPFALGFRGLSGSTSTLNKETVAFLKNMGYVSRAHTSQYDGGTPVSDSLLGLKYLVSKETDSKTDKNWGYLYLRDNENGYVAYKNPNAMQIAYVVNNDIADLYFSDPNPPEVYDEYYEGEIIEYRELYTPFERMNAMVTAMLGEDKTVELFKKVTDIENSDENINVAIAASHRKFSPKNSNVKASLTYTLTSNTNGSVYAYFPSDYPREAKLYINDSYNSKYFVTDYHRIVNLGNYKIGDKITVKLELVADNMYIRDGAKYFWYLDSDLYNEIMPKLAARNIELTDYTESYFKGNVKVEGDFNTVFTTIPFDKGWKAYVNGERVDIYKTLNALVAFDINDGDGVYEVELKYAPAEVYIGIAITAVSVAVFVLICVYEKKLRALLDRIFTPFEKSNSTPKVKR